MKHFLFLPVCLLLVICSCKKSQVINPTGNIVATVKNTAINFNTHITVTIDTTNASVYGSSIIIYGQTDTSASKASISIGITSFNPSGLVTTGSYDSYAAFGSLGYCNVIYKSVLPNTQTEATYSTDPRNYYTSTVIITSSSSSNIQGTFTGTLVSSLGDTTTRVVTNGKFNVPIGKQAL